MAKSCSANVIEIIDSDDELDISHNVGESTTSIGAKYSSVNVIDIIGSDEELDITQNVPRDRQGSGDISHETCFAEEKGKNMDNNHAKNNEENLDACEDILFTSNTKRKRACNVVMSESESDRDDDNMSNSLTTANLEADKVIDDIRIPRCRLKILRKIGSKSRGDKTYGDDELENESNSDVESNYGCLQDNNKDSYLQDASDRECSGNISLSTCSAAEKGNNFDSNYAENSQKSSDLGEDLLCVVTSKRKPTRNVIISESENDDGEDDDDLPISHVISNHVKEISVDELVNVVNDEAHDADDVDADADVDDDIPISQVIRMKKLRRGCLKPLRKCVSKSHDDKVNYQQSIPTNDDAHDDDNVSMEDLSQCEEGNLSDFIDDADVDSDDSNNSQDLQDRSKDSNLQDISDDDHDKILSKIQRKKKQKNKWESEPEMLADLGKDPVLCMKAVCVLYRQQTREEQNIKGTVCRNGRGFSTHHAYSGSKLAEFLLDGSPDGSINKTVEELQKFNPDGVEVCVELAFHYSAQLFDIFQNKEDDFFP